ncbi:mannosyl-oligosaccharide alpha-1:2-mannosidase isoform A-like isoform X2 [Leptotrombidium deliense]|uniref:alpha-1,2-Mannosidase n=1 Tax=Leptotrombidium deliense TaxID=299467 RepID=A0A443SVT0_9ACAR|nr:mannosyl-oligosaccharide alpha-1:2-mannosidase isoform A-like isoform X2 [Leptotrombidium deliense]
MDNEFMYSAQSEHYFNVHNEHFVRQKQNNSRNNNRLQYSVIVKREIIKEMMRHAWNGYVKYAWGDNELRPVSRSGYSPTLLGDTKLGMTIVDALDTLLIMNMNSEFEKGREWIANKFNMDNVYESVSVFEVNIRFVGGLLSCFALTNDSMFLHKAQYVAEKLLPAFDTSTRIPKTRVWLNSKSSTINFRSYTVETSIAEAGSFHLEFVYLSDATKNFTYKLLANNIRRMIVGARNRDQNGLFPVFISTETGMFTTSKVSFGANGDSFYEYLLKAWIQSNRSQKRQKRLFLRTMKEVEKTLLRRTESGFYYLVENMGSHEGMSHLACFSGGLFALAADTILGNKSERFKFLAAELTKTCHESYVNTDTGLGPEMFFLDNQFESDTEYYILRPEVVESYFYLWRTTREQKYRDWAWEVVNALQKHCKTEFGFSGIRNVNDEESEKDDVQQSFFLAETLKYLYLIFSDDLLPLDKWVFNTEGHPLPIKGRNAAYKIN